MPHRQTGGGYAAGGSPSQFEGGAGFFRAAGTRTAVSAAVVFTRKGLLAL